ncbi:MAG: ATP-grasp domain-containing protein [Sphingomonadales bacterium]|nr:ATP-grasp domain-containing protein [Sphingomonadales bacterium]
MSKTILIIGAGREQIPAYELAHEKGYVVVGTDMTADAPALKHADHQLIASTRDAAETLAAVKKFAKDHPIDGVMTIANDVPYTVALVADELGLAGISPKSAKYFMNKIEMKRCFQNANVVTPDFRPIPDLSSFKAALSEMTFPLIIKPSDGRGSRGVLYLDESIDANWAYEHSLASCDNGMLILEQFISGPQLSVEGLFVDGKYYAIAFADRNYSNLQQTRPFIVEDGGQIPSHYEGEMLDEINNVIEKGAQAMGISWGTVKADIVIGDDGPEIIELAGRLSGNYLATHHIPMAYGVDIVGALMDMSLGLAVNPQALVPKHKKYMGVRYFFPEQGTIKAITGVDEVRAKPYCNMLDIFAKVGDVQTTIDNHGARAGTIICEGDDYETAKARVEQAVNKIKFVVD